MNDTYTIDAKKALYGPLGRSTLFRSTLEARWAVAFEKLHLDWRYEPRCFAVPPGAQYTPDFYLAGVGWIEIKPHMRALRAVEWKLHALAEVIDDAVPRSRSSSVYSIDAAHVSLGRSGPQTSSVIEWTEHGVRMLSYQEALQTVAASDGRRMASEYPERYADYADRVFRDARSCHLTQIELID